MLIDTLVKRTPILKGFSCDNKYCAEAANGTKYFLRISPLNKYDARRALFELLKSLEEFHIPMCKPVEIGTYDEGVYTLFSWIDGIDAKEAIPLYADAKQYGLGLEAGTLLRKYTRFRPPRNKKIGIRALTEKPI